MNSSCFKFRCQGVQITAVGNEKTHGPVLSKRFQCSGFSAQKLRSLYETTKVSGVRFQVSAQPVAS